MAKLEARLEELPRTQKIVAYCRGPYCVFADEAVTLLCSCGFATRRLDVGILEWRRPGLPITIEEKEASR